MKRFLVVGAPVLVALLAACSSDSVTNPGASLSLTADDSAQAVALSAADATSEDVDVMLASDLSVDAGTYSASVGTSGSGASLTLAPVMPSFDVSGDTARVGFWAFGSGCVFNASSGRFTCPDVTHNGLTLSRSVAFFDANGTAMSRYNDTLTASANFQLSVNGIRLVSTGADTISRQRSMTATGLLGHETSRTWNGTGTRVDGGYRVDSTRTRTYSTADTTTFANIVVHLPRSQYPFPFSGTITRKIAGSGSVVRATGTRTFTFTRTVTITFNGTRYVPMMVGTRAFTLDLVTGRATKA